MVQKSNLVNAYNNNTAFKNFLRNVMALSNSYNHLKFAALSDTH